jgi:hypothetical protein
VLGAEKWPQGIDVAVVAMVVAPQYEPDPKPAIMREREESTVPEIRTASTGATLGIAESIMFEDASVVETVIP